MVRADHMGRIEDGHFVIQHLVVYYFMSMLHAGPATAPATETPRLTQSAPGGIIPLLVHDRKGAE